MDREAAKQLIATSISTSLKNDQRRDMLSEYWCYDTMEDIKADIQSKELPVLSDQLIQMMLTEEIPEHADKTIFEPLIIDYLVFDLRFSTNKYLEDKLSLIGQSIRVEGPVETAGMCPCCQYLSIEPGEDGLWDICPVCFWENGGDGPNHMSLAEAQANFESFGAIDERSLKFINTEGSIKYERVLFEENNH